MTKKIADKRRHKYDWEAIWVDYRAGIISVREVARKHNIDHAYLLRKAKELGVERDLTAKIKQAAKIKLAKRAVKKPTKKVTKKSPKHVENPVTTQDANQIIEEKSDELLEIQILHRRDIRALRNEEQRLLAELGDDPKKLWVGQYKGEIVTKEFKIAVTERASALQSLASAMHKRIVLERRAYGLEDGDDDFSDLKTTLTPTEQQLFRKAARIVSQRVIEQAREDMDE